LPLPLELGVDRRARLAHSRGRWTGRGATRSEVRPVKPEAEIITGEDAVVPELAVAATVIPPPLPGLRHGLRN